MLSNVPITKTQNIFQSATETIASLILGQNSHLLFTNLHLHVDNTVASTFPWAGDY